MRASLLLALVLSFLGLVTPSASAGVPAGPPSPVLEESYSVHVEGQGVALWRADERGLQVLVAEDLRIREHLDRRAGVVDRETHVRRIALLLAEAPPALSPLAAEPRSGWVVYGYDLTESGRFLQNDPILGNRASEGYAYAGGGPTNATDPMGTDIVVGGVLGEGGQAQRNFCAWSSSLGDHPGLDLSMAFATGRVSITARAGAKLTAAESALLAVANDPSYTVNVEDSCPACLLRADVEILARAGAIQQGNPGLSNAVMARYWFPDAPMETEGEWEMLGDYAAEYQKAFGRRLSTEDAVAGIIIPAGMEWGFGRAMSIRGRWQVYDFEKHPVRDMLALASVFLPVGCGGAAGSGGTRVSLGKSIGLDEFAAATGGQTWKVWAKDAMMSADPAAWRGAFSGVMANEKNAILVNLNGVEGGAWGALGRAAANRGGAMDWELRQIYEHKDWWGRITFYKGGKVVPNPFK